MTKRLTMTEDEALHALGYCNKTGRYKFSDKTKWQEALDKRKEYRENFKFNQYCKENNIQQEDVSLYWDKSKDFSILVRPNQKTDADLMDSISERIKEQPHKFKPFVPKKTIENNLLVIDIADAHIGKLSTSYETGDQYGIEIAKQRCYDGVNGIISRASQFDISKIMFVIGNDVLHYDNPRRTTTSGTPQDTDGMFYDMFNSALDMYINIINELRLTYEVDVIFNASNHDYMSGWMLARALSMYFHNADNVSVDDGISHRKYYKFGNNLIGTNHGDGAKMQDLPLLMANEVPDLWASTKYRYVYLHHLHHKQTHKFMSGKDFIGVTVEYLRSPSSSDSWHHRNGYVGAKKAIEGYIHNYEDGQIARITKYF